MKTKSIILGLTLVLGLFSASFATNVSPLTTAKGKYQLKDSTCAEIILKQGEIIEAKISKITENSIEYIKCGTTQPVYEIGKDKVLMIKYPDGRTEKFSTTYGEKLKIVTGFFTTKYYKGEKQITFKQLREYLQSDDVSSGYLAGYYIGLIFEAIALLFGLVFFLAGAGILVWIIFDVIGLLFGILASSSLKTAVKRYNEKIK